MRKRYEVILTPNDKIGLIIPSDGGSEHTVEIPMTFDGLRLLRTILIARKYEPEAKIGSEAAPVASDILRFLKEKKEQLPEPRSPQPPVMPKQQRLAPDLQGLELDI